MKVLDFWAGCPVAVINNWCSPLAWWLAFIRQSYIAEILGWVPDEVHCYDRISLSKWVAKQPLESDLGKIVLHANQRWLPRSVDMICAFNPDPVSIFGPQKNFSFAPEKNAGYVEYAPWLSHLIRTRLRGGGLLAIQFDECVKPPMDVPYDATQPFLNRVLMNTQSQMKDLYHSDWLPEVAGVVPFKGVYSFSSLHIFQKIGDIVGV